MPIVQEPLAAVLARKDGPVKRPRDLDGNTVGVTGLPSDTAVVDSEVAADGGDPNGVDEVTIGFNAVASLAAGKVDAATGFWNDEAVEAEAPGHPAAGLQSRRIRRAEIPRAGADDDAQGAAGTTPTWSNAMVQATHRGYEFTEKNPSKALDDLLAANPSLEKADTEAQLKVLLPALHPEPFKEPVLKEWSAWATSHGLLPKPLDVQERLRPRIPAASAG